MPPSPRPRTIKTFLEVDVLCFCCWGGLGLFNFHITVMKEVRAGTLAATWRQTWDRQMPWRNSAYWLAQPAFSLQLGTTCLGVTRPTLGWVLLYQFINQGNIPQACLWRAFSVALPSSQITLACGKLTKKKKKQQTNNNTTNKNPVQLMRWLQLFSLAQKHPFGCIHRHSCWSGSKGLHMLVF